MNAFYTPLNFSHKSHEKTLIHAKNYHVGLRAALFSMFILFATFVYNVMAMDTMSLRVWNRSFTDAGMILVGISFALSGLCYFYDIFDTKILYRRDLGLNGFYFIALHSVYSFALNKFTPWYRYFESDRVLSFSLALISLLIFFMMALISNAYVPKKLGAHRWRILLRIGYFAYVLGVVHAGLWSYEDWVMWWGSPKVPPMSLVVSVLVLGVVILRIFLWRALQKRI